MWEAGPGLSGPLLSKTLCPLHYSFLLSKTVHSYTTALENAF